MTDTRPDPEHIVLGPRKGLTEEQALREARRDFKRAEAAAVRPAFLADDTRPMRDKFRFLVTDAAEGVVLREALMSMRNRDGDWPSDVLRAEAADRLLARLDHCIRELADLRRRESEVPDHAD